MNIGVWLLTGSSIIYAILGCPEAATHCPQNCFVATASKRINFGFRRLVLFVFHHSFEPKPKVLHFRELSSWKCKFSYSPVTLLMADLFTHFPKK